MTHATTLTARREPELFGQTTGSGAPPSDPKGNPPKPKTGDTAYDRGKERAKGRTPSDQYAFEKVS